MTTILELGDYEFSLEQIIPLLAQYNLIPHLLRDRLLDDAIANTASTSLETTAALSQFYQRWNIRGDDQLVSWRSRYSLLRISVRIFGNPQVKN